MDEGRIVLDRKAFGALAVDSRVKLLKALTGRRKMLTELAAELKLSASSTKEHLDTLVEAGLIEKFDEGHKWKYYALTRKGSGIITPDREIKVWVVLGMSIIGLLISSLLMFNALPVGAAGEASQTMALAAPSAPVTAPAPAAPLAPATSGRAQMNDLAKQGVVTAAAEAPPPDSPPPSLYMVFSALCAVIAAVCVVYLAIDRMR